MAYFRCSTGSASSGDGVALVVECDVNFAGSTITADNGEDVFTEICPSVSPYTVRFEGIPTGTYTISGVSQGQTFATQFTVLDYETTLSAIPEGATVLPINDIQIWLHCSNIWDKNYTSISQVLADASTLQALIASNNAVDYMARSTTWANSVTANSNAMTYIGANDYCADTLLSDATWLNAICDSTYFESVLSVKIPTMTSNTTPSGEAFAKYSYGDKLAYKAFDGNNTTYWENQGPSSGYSDDKDNLGYMFTQKVNIKKLVITNLSGVQTYYLIKSFTLFASNDKTNWTDIKADCACAQNGSTTINIIGNNTKYKYWAIGHMSSWYNTNDNYLISIPEFQMYGRA